MGRVVILTFLILTGISLTLIISLPATSAASAEVRGSIKVSKTIPRVTLDDRVSIALTIENNGTVPVFDLQVYEYMNPKLHPNSSITVQTPSARSIAPVAAGSLASASQVIVDPPPPNTLRPGEKITLTYTELAPNAGDYQIPTSLVWFKYEYGSSTLTVSFYSNGLILHVPNAAEKAIIQIYPYLLSATTFASTMTILLWARNRLSKLKKSRLQG